MGSIKRFFINLFVTPEIGSLVRHSITSLATVLIGIGALDPELSDQFIDANSQVFVGVAVWLINLMMSFKQKGDQKIEVKQLQAEVRKMNMMLSSHLGN